MTQSFWVSVLSGEGKDVVVEITPQEWDPSLSSLDSLLEFLAETQFEHLGKTIDSSFLCAIDSDGKDLDCLPDGETSSERPLRIVFTRTALESFGINDLRWMISSQDITGIKAKGKKPKLVNLMDAIQRRLPVPTEDDDEAQPLHQSVQMDVRAIPADDHNTSDSADVDESFKSTTEELQHAVVGLADGSSEGYETPPEEEETTSTLANTETEAGEAGFDSSVHDREGLADGHEEVEGIAEQPNEEPTVTVDVDLTADHTSLDKCVGANEPESLRSHGAEDALEVERQAAESKGDTQAGSNTEAPEHAVERQEQELATSTEQDMTEDGADDKGGEIPREMESPAIALETAGTAANTDTNDNQSETDSQDAEFTLHQLRLLVGDLKDRALNLLSKEEKAAINTEQPPASPTKSHMSGPTTLGSPSSSVSSRRGQTKVAPGPRRAQPTTPASNTATKMVRPLSPRVPQRPLSPRKPDSSIPTPGLRVSKSTPVVAAPSSTRKTQQSMTSSASGNRIRPKSPVPSGDSASRIRPKSPVPSGDSTSRIRPKSPVPPASSTAARPPRRPSNPDSVNSHQSSGSSSRITASKPPSPGASRQATSTAASARAGATPSHSAVRPRSPRADQPVAASTPTSRPRSPRPPSAQPPNTTRGGMGRTAASNHSASTRAAVVPVRAGSAGDRNPLARPNSPKPSTRRSSVDSPASVSNDAGQNASFEFEHTRTHSASVDASTELVRPPSSDSATSSTVPFSTTTATANRPSSNRSVLSNDSETSVDSKLSGIRSVDSLDSSFSKASTASVIRGAKPPPGRGLTAQPRMRSRSPVPPISRSESQPKISSGAVATASKRTVGVTQGSKLAAPGPGIRPMRSISQPEIRPPATRTVPVASRAEARIPAPAPVAASTTAKQPAPVAASTTAKQPAPVAASTAAKQPAEPTPLPEVFGHITGVASRTSAAEKAEAAAKVEAAEAVPIVFPTEARPQLAPEAPTARSTSRPGAAAAAATPATTAPQAANPFDKLLSGAAVGGAGAGGGNNSS